MEAGLTWSTWKKRKDIPPTAVCAGKDRDGSPIYVARAKHDGDLLPGKVIASSHMAYVPYEGKEICLDNFEVLTGTDFTWVASSNGLVPTGAFVAGKTASGKPLYVGRTDYNGSVVPGKIVSSHGCLYISFDGIEHSFKTYQVLDIHGFLRPSRIRALYQMVYTLAKVKMGHQSTLLEGITLGTFSRVK
ncbi:hypothetical protein ZHAS_00004877 [Anopheles sinensis]|uniref:Uncharacterized protein n=1 Tax=Anopheles sinensis TaxID=74873 RepID=A0A084VI45_ANOSI|nr:hypothetical protein ZHAS_00004877 [Anopheles sinensis]